MGIIQDRIEVVQQLLEKVEQHPMVLRLTEQQYYYFVHLPYGYELDAVRIAKGNNKTEALTKLLAKLEQLWEESFAIKTIRGN